MMSKGNYVLNQKPRPNLGINYAGLPILEGESYGGRPEWTDPECPQLLSGTGEKRRRKITVNQKQRGFGAGYWAKLRADPEQLKEHLRKVKEGMARRRAEKALKSKTHGKWVKQEEQT
jgi:hypothetical protein